MDAKVNRIAQIGKRELVLLQRLESDDPAVEKLLKLHKEKCGLLTEILASHGEAVGASAAVVRAASEPKHK